MEQKERNIEFFISNIGGKENTEVVDLNKIFQMNFSYNFDLLKNLIEALMKNQKNFQAELKEKTNKINELENQLLDLKLFSVNGNNVNLISKDKTHIEKASPDQIQINNEFEELLNPKLLSVIKGDKDIIRVPPNDIKLEETSKDDKINNIIVSIFIFY